MKKKGLFHSLMLVVLMLSLLNNVFIVQADDEQNTYSSGLITYSADSWSKRTNNIGKAVIMPESIQLIGDPVFDLNSWQAGVSTKNLALQFDVSLAFSTDYTGYRNIQFLSEYVIGFVLSATLNDTVVLLTYPLDYDSSSKSFIPPGNQGYLQIGSADAKLVDISQSIANRSEIANLTSTFKSSTVNTSHLNASLAELNNPITFVVGNYSWQLDTAVQRDYEVALLKEGSNSETIYTAYTVIPAYFIDVLKNTTEEMGGISGSITLQIAPAYLGFSLVKYEFDYKVEVMDVKDIVAEVGQRIDFTSSVKENSVGTIAADEVFYDRASFFEVSKDNGKSWTKISDSDNKDSISITATAEMDGWLYRNVVLVADSKQTRINSLPGKLTVNNKPTTTPATPTQTPHVSPATAVSNQLKYWLLMSAGVIAALIYGGIHNKKQKKTSD